jgi:hypothetical protein
MYTLKISCIAHAYGKLSEMAGARNSQASLFLSFLIWAFRVTGKLTFENISINIGTDINIATADSRRHDPPFSEIRKLEVLCRTKVQDPFPYQGTKLAKSVSNFQLSEF